MLPWILAYFLTYSDISVTLKWRFILGLGFVPGIVVVIGSYIERSRLPPVTYSKNSINVWRLLQDKRIIKKLIVTGGGWFLYDVCYYGVNLFGGEIVAAITNSDDDNVSSNESIRKVTSQELIAISTSIPACIITIWLFGFGVKRLQVYGFVFIAVCFVLLATLFTTLKKENPNALYAIYCFLLFSLSFGPNVTTFILPAQTYPREIRSTFNGISAAMGKLGAVVGAYVYGIVAAVTSYEVVMIICAVLALVGAVVTQIWIPEDGNNDDDFQVHEILIKSQPDDEDVNI